MLNRIIQTSLLALLFTGIGRGQSTRDTMADTWTGADDLGRVVPGPEEAGPPRPGKTVAMFYFLWLGAHERGGPYDITKILEKDPDAMQKPDSPLWGALGAPHHWGQSHMGYYRTDDEFVLAKHAQMLTDAGVDTVVFDVTNQFTYAHEYRTLLEVFARVRKNGGKAPQIAFLCPFWTPRKVVRELWRELYSKGDHSDQWFRLDGKPFILADPTLIGQTLAVETHDGVTPMGSDAVFGQTFTLTEQAASVSASFATWGSRGAGVTLTLRRPGGEAVLSRAFTDVQDNGWLELRPDQPLEPGEWVLEASGAAGKVGWWTDSKAPYAGGTATEKGAPVPGDRMFRAELMDEESRAIRSFFTFRSPQADYFRGPTRPDMWSWLEIAPQHVFRNSRGEPEMMSAGVAQNAVNGRLGSLSEAGALGRSFHGGKHDTTPGAERRGLNFAEQWRNVKAADPAVVFVTGWNEWIAGRHAEFNGVREPVMFVDQFDLENSRDIEPMRGGHGDDYYYQLVSEVRRFKGVRPTPSSGAEKTIDIGPDFRQWTGVEPVYADDAGDTVHRDHSGYAGFTRYVNRSGRNDIVECRVARDPERVAFYAKTAAPLTDAAGADWMRLLINTDADPKTGWNGFEFRVSPGGLEKWNGEKWEKNAGEVTSASAGAELHLSVPRAALGLAPGTGMRFDFKWMDNIPAEAPPIDWIDTGDTAPNSRFSYRFSAK